MPTPLEYLTDPGLGLIREVRQSQRQMAVSVEDVLANGGVYFCEGPVGCGKTFAYLTPAIMAAGRRVVIATAKKQLQDQINNKDLPTITKVIGPERMRKLLVNDDGDPMLLSSVVKGKGNYACRMMADDHKPDREYTRFLQASRYGDRADYEGSVPDWWSAATAEDCIGRGCKYSQDCGYMRLKGGLASTRVVVVNHHLLGADMFYGRGKLVGGLYDTLIIDEAHKLAEGIRAAFTVKIAENAISDLVVLLSKTPFNFTGPKQLLTVWDELFKAIPNRHWRESHLREVPVFPEHAEAAIDGIGVIDQELGRFFGNYGVTQTPRDPEFWEALATVQVEDESVTRDLMTVAQGWRKTTDIVRGINLCQGRVVQNEDEDDAAYDLRKERILANTVAYGNADRRGRFHVNCAPINLGGIAKNYFAGIKSVVLTSATLAIGDNFDHLSDVVGVTATKSEVLPSTFDYTQQGFLYVPRDIPYRNRSAPDYDESMYQRVTRAIDLVRLSNGGAFILTTANDELDLFADRLKEAFPGRVFAQDHAKRAWDGDPPTILAAYLRTPNSVLVGSKSFWEGVDVVGEQLRLVIISKLPFPIYNDPIIKARERVAGAAAFHRVQLVDMLTDLRQGAGRLIRSKSDRGVVAILDSRVWEKPYGRHVRSSLKFPVTDAFSQCEKYLPRFVQYFERMAQKGLHVFASEPKPT